MNHCQRSTYEPLPKEFLRTTAKGVPTNHCQRSSYEPLPKEYLHTYCTTLPFNVQMLCRNARTVRRILRKFSTWWPIGGDNFVAICLECAFVLLLQKLFPVKMNIYPWFNVVHEPDRQTGFQDSHGWGRQPDGSSNQHNVTIWQKSLPTGTYKHVLEKMTDNKSLRRMELVLPNWKERRSGRCGC
jgi:hypothetical protein